LIPLPASSIKNKSPKKTHEITRKFEDFLKTIDKEEAQKQANQKERKGTLRENSIKYC
jgi:hypothetical protein